MKGFVLGMKKEEKLNAFQVGVSCNEGLGTCR
jgi:hypothetical protein